MESLPLHSHTEQLERVKNKASNGEQLNSEDIRFLFDTIEELEGQLKEWIDMYKENINNVPRYSKE